MWFGGEQCLKPLSFLVVDNVILDGAVGVTWDSIFMDFVNGPRFNSSTQMMEGMNGQCGSNKVGCFVLADTELSECCWYNTHSGYWIVFH